MTRQLLFYVQALTLCLVLVSSEAHAQFFGCMTGGSCNVSIINLNNNQVNCALPTATCLFTSNTDNATTTGAVGAFTFTILQNLVDTDIGWDFKNSSGTVFRILEGGGTISSGNMNPGTDLTSTLGTNTLRWNSVFAQTYADSGSANRISIGSASTANLYIGRVANTSGSYDHVFTQGTAKSLVDNGPAKFCADGSQATGCTAVATVNSYGEYTSGAGTGTPNAVKVGGTLVVNTTGVGNVGASGPDDLQSATITANTLITTGRCFEIIATGSTANNANAKTVRLMIGATALITKQLTVSIAGSWKLSATVCRTGASAQKYNSDAVNFGGTTVSSTDGATVALLASNGTLAETETASITIKTQSTVSTADNDIVSQMLVIKYL